MLFYLLNMAKCPSRLQCKTTYLISTHISNTFTLLKYLAFIDSSAEEMTGKGGEREGEWWQLREDKASVHGTPALPSELNGTPENVFLNLEMKCTGCNQAVTLTRKWLNANAIRVLNMLLYPELWLTVSPDVHDLSSFICWSIGKLSDSLCFKISYLGHSSSTITSQPESDLRGKWLPCEHGLKFMACSVCFWDT